MYSFLNWQSDSNVMRPIGPPFQYWSHPEYILKNHQPHEQKLKCPAILGLSCPICVKAKDEDKTPYYANNSFLETSSSTRWIIPVICRRVNDIRLVDIGGGTFVQLKKYALDTRWGNPEKYDIDIIRLPHNHEATVMVKSPIPLSAADLVLKTSLNKNELNDLTKPTPEDLLCILNNEYQELNQ